MRTRFLGLCWVCWARILALMLLTLLAAKAFAEPVEASPAQPLVPPEDAPLADGTRERTPPDYRGQEPPRPRPEMSSSGDRGSSSSRPYLVTEYLVRARVGGLATVAEKDNWGPSVFNFFAFGPDHEYGIFPVFLFNFGFRPSIGTHFFWDDAVAKGNNFTTDVGYGGSNWITMGLGDRYNFSKNDWLAVETRWDRRPDNLFYGIGSEVSDDFKSRWGSDHIEGSVTYTHVIRRVLRLDAKARIYRTIFRDYTCCSDPTIQQWVDAGQYSAPPGYGENTTAAELGFKAVLDTRAPIGNRSGFRVGVSAARGST